LLSVANRLGLRNLWRRRRRSVLTWLMIAAGTTLVVFSVGLAEGTYKEMIELATSSSTGQFQLQAAGYLERPSLFRNLSADDSLAQALAARPEVEAITPRLETAGLLAAGARSTGVLLVGVDPRQEGQVTSLPGTLDEGQWLDAPADSSVPPLLLGRGLARRLGVATGDTISFVGQAADGSIAAQRFRLQGLLSTGAQEADASLALARLADLQDLLVLPGRAHRLVGRLVRLGALDHLLANFDPGPERRLLGWPEILPDLHSSIQADRAGGRISLAIIIAVALLGVGNTMLMSVFERTREFGVMLALGTAPGRLVRAVLWEAFWLSISGVLTGVAAGSAINTRVALSVGKEPIEFGGVVLTVMHAANTVEGSVVYPLIILSAGLVAGLLPALRAARLSPVDALSRH